VKSPENLPSSHSSHSYPLVIGHTVTLFRSDQGVVIITKRKGLAAAGVVALIAAGTAACGTVVQASPQASPQGSVQNAFTKLADQKSLTLDASFNASADQIYAAMKGEDGFTKADAQVLADLRATYAVSSDKPLGQVKAGDKNGTFGFLLSDAASAGKNLIEVRSIGGKLYVRADVKGLAKLDTSSSGHGGPLSLGQLAGKADQLPSSAGSLKDALKGEWISIDPQTFGGWAAPFTGKASGTPWGLDATSEASLVTALKNALAHNGTFKDLGTQGGADHVQVSVPAQQLAKELKSGLAPAFKGLPGFWGSGLGALDNVPNKTVTAEVAIKGGTVSGITVDVAQFNSKAHTGTLPLTLALDGAAAKVSAPAGAKAFKLQDLVGLFMSGTWSGGWPGSDNKSSGFGFNPGNGSSSNSVFNSI
jgi:hypothetical protein